MASQLTNRIVTGVKYLSLFTVAFAGVLFAEIRFDYGVAHEGYDPSRLSATYALMLAASLIPAGIWLALINKTKAVTASLLVYALILLAILLYSNPLGSIVFGVPLAGLAIASFFRLKTHLPER